MGIGCVGRIRNFLFGLGMIGMFFLFIEGEIEVWVG